MNKNQKFKGCLSVTSILVRGDYLVRLLMEDGLFLFGVS